MKISQKNDFTERETNSIPDQFALLGVIELAIKQALLGIHTCLNKNNRYGCTNFKCIVCICLDMRPSHFMEHLFLISDRYNIIMLSAFI